MVYETQVTDFSEIYERNAADVYRFSLYLTGNHAVAEDLTSETFVHALCGRTELRVDTVKAYLFAIARNLYRDGMKRQSRQSPSGKSPEQPDSSPSADRAIEDRQTLAAVLRAMQELPATLREALVLSVDHDLRHDQIAAILGCSTAAVKVRVHRARLQLGAELERPWRI